jgi:hypothetical protein
MNRDRSNFQRVIQSGRKDHERGICVSFSNAAMVARGRSILVAILVVLALAG